MGEQPSTGSPTDVMDRRSALKKAAVAGTIVWSAPMVLSTKASAQDNPVCTLKCGPRTVAASLAVDGAKGPCVDGAPPGSQNRTFDITNITIVGSSATCGCGPQAVPTVDFSAQTITYTDPDTSQGTRTVDIGTVQVSFSCTDRRGATVRTTCTATIRATFSGSCEGQGNTSFAVSALSGCSTFCIPAPGPA